METEVDSTGYRVRHRSGFFVRWDAVITVIVASLVAFCLGMAAQFAIDHADPFNGVPACTDQIADAGGICHGEPR
jgi:hypothetical protein